jgi:hypothetical protein
MQAARLSLGLLLVGTHATEIAFDLSQVGDSFVLNEGGTVSLVGGELAGRPVMCYRDFANNEFQGSLTCRLLTSTSEVDAASSASVVVSQLNSEKTSFATLDASTAVVCYAAVARNEGRPTCNVVFVSGSNIQAGPDLVVNATDTNVEFTTVTGLSSMIAVMCYRTSQLSINGILRCSSLTRSGDGLTVDDTVLINGRDDQDCGDQTPASRTCAFTFAASVVGLSDSLAMVCFADDWAATDQGGCNSLIVLPGNLTKQTNFFSLQETKFTKHVVAQGLTGDTAMVCYTEGTSGSQGSDTGPGSAGSCAWLQVSETTISRAADVSVATGDIAQPVLKRFSDETAVLCYLGEGVGGSTEGVCVELAATDSALVKGDKLRPSGAKVGHRAAVASVTDTDGVVCYTEVGVDEAEEWGRCIAVEVVPTSTSTSTPHTTTGTSVSQTSTQTSVTTLTETSSTSATTTPHTTTETTLTTATVTATSVTTSTIVEESSSASARGAHAFWATSLLALGVAAPGNLWS